MIRYKGYATSFTCAFDHINLYAVIGAYLPNVLVNVSRTNLWDECSGRKGGLPAGRQVFFSSPTRTKVKPKLKLISPILAFIKHF